MGDYYPWVCWTAKSAAYHISFYVDSFQKLTSPYFKAFKINRPEFEAIVKVVSSDSVLLIKPEQGLGYYNFTVKDSSADVRYVTKDKETTKRILFEITKTMTNLILREKVESEINSICKELW